MPAAGGAPLLAKGGNGLTFDPDRVYWWDQAYTADDDGMFSAVVLSAPR
jgi:hypothetical protein